MGAMDDPARSGRDQPSRQTDPLTAGDTAAEYGWWPEAVAAWQRALSTPSRLDAIERLTWFVTWRSGRGPGRFNDVDHAPSALPSLLLSLACGFLGTAAVLVAEGMSGWLQTTVVGVAWLLYAVSAGLSLVFAARTQQRRKRAPRDLDRGETTKLCRDATALAWGEPLGHEGNGV